MPTHLRKVEKNVDNWHPEGWLRKGKRFCSLSHRWKVTSMKACAPCLDGNFWPVSCS